MNISCSYRYLSGIYSFLLEEIRFIFLPDYRFDPLYWLVYYVKTVSYLFVLFIMSDFLIISEMFPVSQIFHPIVGIQKHS